jgi:hypothetical protein
MTRWTGRVLPATGMLLGLSITGLSLAPSTTGCDQTLPAVEDAGPDVRPDPCEAGSPPTYCAAGQTDGPVSTCLGAAPDGVCDLASEGCDCLDCITTARCTDRCVDDQTCTDLEDCSCADCHDKVARCARPVGCHDDGVCSPLDDDCTCADCLGERSCQECTDNGYCAEYSEGCGCADCQTTARCLPDAGPPDAGPDAAQD